LAHCIVMPELVLSRRNGVEEAISLLCTQIHGRWTESCMIANDTDFRPTNRNDPQYPLISSAITAIFR
jgi:hypothetical protein